MRVRRAGAVTLTAVVLGLAASAAWAAEEPSPAPAEASTAAAPATPEADYYTRRAESVLAAEKARGAKPHPLAEAYPGFDVVVCEAGCPTGNDPQVVFARAHGHVEGEMVTTSARAYAATIDEDAPACVAGCYGEAAAAATVDMPPLRLKPALTTNVSEASAEAMPTEAAPAVAPPVPPRPPVRDKLSPIR